MKEDNFELILFPVRNFNISRYVCIQMYLLSHSKSAKNRWFPVLFHRFKILELQHRGKIAVIYFSKFSPIKSGKFFSIHQFPKLKYKYNSFIRIYQPKFYTERGNELLQLVANFTDSNYSRISVEWYGELAIQSCNFSQIH